MGQNNMGLPGGANDWAREVTKALETLAQLQEMARRICSDFGLDIANPARGLYTGATPSVENPVQLKLPSLQDLDIRDAQDGDLLTFDGKRGVWVARAHDTVQLPKEFPLGDPDSYYVPGAEFIPADHWSFGQVFTNNRTDPSFEHGTDAWEHGGEESNGNTNSVFTNVSGGRRGQAMQIAYSNTSPFFPEQATGARLRNLPLDTRVFSVWIQGGNATRDVGIYLAYEYDGEPRDTEAQDNATLAPGEWRLFRVVGNPGTGLYSPIPSHVSAWIGMAAVTTGTPQTVVVDECLISSDPNMPYTLGPFNGETPDTGDYTFAWTGEPDASTSTATRNRLIQIPSEAPQGSVIQVIGQGFVPGETVDLYLGGDLLGTINAEPDGTFDARLTIPADAEVYEFSSISALVDPGTDPWATINITAAE